MSSSSTFSGAQALVVEGRTAKWAGPDAGEDDIDIDDHGDVHDDNYDKGDWK